MSPERSHTDIEFRDLLRYKVGFEELIAGLESWMREALVKPFSYEGVIDNGEFVAFGQNMVDMGKHGLQERIGQVGQERAEADLRGIIQIESWLRDKANDGDMICLLSPPGSEDEGFGANGQRRLSFTQFGFAHIEGDKRSVRMVSLPELEIGIHSHLWRLYSVWPDTINPWLQKVVKTDKGLVSSPVIIPAAFVSNGYDKYAQLMGKSGWSEVEEELKAGMVLKEDIRAESRRKSLINTIAWQVRKYVDGRDEKRLDNISLVARIVMAREASGKYLRWTEEQLNEKYYEIEAAHWYQQELGRKGIIERARGWILNGAEAMQSWRVLRELMVQLANEQDVMSLLSGSSCGGGGIGDLLSGRMWGENIMTGGTYLDQLASRAGAMQQNDSKSNSVEIMKCVKCPFCHETVDAEVTSEKITCPKCHESASKS